MGLWSVTLGHNHPEHVGALVQALGQGTQHTLMHPLEVEMAEALAAAVPIAEMCRFGRNGSDVTTAAIRLARAITGRDVVVRSGYHGWHDWSMATTEHANGIPAFNRAISACFADGDRAGFDEIMARFDGKVAAVIMEGLQTKAADREFLRHVRSVTRRAGTLLIFDEVVNGYRLALGGAHEFLDIDADLVTFGKGVANGTPLSILAGRREIMRNLDRVFFSLTFGGETLGLTAGLTVLGIYRRENVVKRLWEVGARLQKAAACEIERAGLAPFISLSACPVRTVWQFSEPYPGCEPAALQTLLQQELLSRGILWAGWHALCLALADDSAAQEQILNAVGEALENVADAIETESVKKRLLGQIVSPVFKRH
jgi:glutamate-1-semialdehyde aminotransferase